jgi:nicotinate-nucleotide adenylyltransferase
MAHIGLLGGTFNPPHLGHLLMAQEAWSQLGLDRVELMPVHTPPHKEAEGDPGPEVRLELCRLAVGDDPRLAVSAFEVERPGPSYTAATLAAIRETSPQDELTFIVGGDQAQALPTWREPQRVLELARLAVGERSGVRRQDIAERLDGLCDPERITFFDMPRMDVSSSEVRRRVAAGRPVRYLVPDAVARSIAAHSLYREGLAVPTRSTA